MQKHSEHNTQPTHPAAGSHSTLTRSGCPSYDSHNQGHRPSRRASDELDHRSYKASGRKVHEQAASTTAKYQHDHGRELRHSQVKSSHTEQHRGREVPYSSSNRAEHYSRGTCHWQSSCNSRQGDYAKHVHASEQNEYSRHSEHERDYTSSKKGDHHRADHRTDRRSGGATEYRDGRDRHAGSRDRHAGSRDRHTSKERDYQQRRQRSRSPVSCRPNHHQQSR